MTKRMQIVFYIIVFVIGLFNHSYACHVPDENVDIRGNDITENWKIDAINCHDEAEFWRGAFIGAAVLGVVAIIGTVIYNQSNNNKSVKTINHPKVTPTIKPKKKEIGTILTFRY